MSQVKKTTIDAYDFHQLQEILRHQRPDDPREGYVRIEGLHPKCDGFCTIVSESKDGEDQQYSVKKPHSECDPVECMEFSRCKCSGGSMYPLPSLMLDCNQPAKLDD